MYNTLKPSNIREENMKQIIKLFRTSEGLFSRAEISRTLSLSAPTVSAIITNMIEANILFESEEGDSSKFGGRKPILLDLNKNCGYIIGVHIENDHNLTIVLANIAGQIKDQMVIDYFSPTEINCVTVLMEEIHSILAKNKVDVQKLLAIGITMPGIFDAEEKIIKFAPNIRMWENLPIKEELEKEFQCETIIENAVNSAVLGERWKGKLTGTRNAIYVKVDKGIGAGILIEGQLFKGFRNLAGEIGFMVTDPSRLPGEKQNYGALESFCGTTAVVEAAQNLLTDQGIDFKTVVKLAKEGNSQLTELLQEVSSNIAIAIANIVCVLNPEVVVIGGGFKSAATMFMNQITELIEKVVPRAPKIMVSELGEDVYYLGAIVQALEEIEGKVVHKYFA